MNAEVKDAPLRPDPALHIFLDVPHVVVTREWFDANEAQRQHLLDAALTAERDAAAIRRDADERIDYLKNQLLESQAAVAHWRERAEAKSTTGIQLAEEPEAARIARAG